ncbi:MAG: SUMF1/EgtB/PvdO family nonheme iron enzyme [Victivallales bacterium]|nr:SUMF1/EgtB/PvdO family nonheme iron enzyme [Victivallales bacterium]
MRAEPFEGNKRNDDGSVPTEKHPSDSPIPAEDHSHDDDNDHFHTGGATPPGRHFKIGDVILKRYEVQAELGQSGMGVVYKCFDKIEQTFVAVKGLPPEISNNPAAMEEVRDNYMLVTKLSHPNIAVCKTLERDNDTGNYYLIMEYVDGESLRQWMRRMRREGKMTLDAALPVLRQIAETLDAAHQQGVIHRDIKPDNVKFTADGTAKVLDFGLAAHIRSSMAHFSSKSIASAGTNLYKSPEQWRASLHQGEASDQYSLAVTAYEMLSGHLPFVSDDKAVLKEAVLHGERRPIEGLPAYANAALMAGLAKKAEDRYANCVDFVRALGGEKVKPGCGMPKGSGRLWAAVAAVVVIAAGLGYYLLNGSTEKTIVDPSLGHETVGGVQKTEKQEAGVDQSDNRVAVDRTKADAANTADGGAGQEKRISEIRDGYYLLKGELDYFNNAQNISTLDRGGMFGEQTDEFQKNYNAGLAAHNDKEYEKAHEYFKKALVNKKWLVDNLKPRDDAAKARKSAEEAKADAEAQNPSMYACAAWDDAGKGFDDAAALYDQGRFEEAKSGFDKAEKAYAKAKEEAVAKHVDGLVKRVSEIIKTDDLKPAAEAIRELEKLSAEKAEECRRNVEKEAGRRQIPTLLKEARNALAVENWQIAFDKASEALKNDQDNEEARTIKQQSGKHLKPTATVVATVDGRPVTAYMDYEGKRYETPLPYNELQEGGRLNGTLSWRKGDVGYEGKFDRTVNWMGHEVITVELQKTEFDGTVILPGGVKLEMVKIPKGDFTMGSPEGELGRYLSETKHHVYLSKDFWLGKTEVTQAQYEALMKGNPSNFKKGGDYPVEKVTWNDAMEFCRRLTELERNAGRFPKGYEYTLPTEAQWEYACRAGTTTALNNGMNLMDEKYNCENLNETAWYDYHKDERSTHPVGLKKENKWGLYDMQGNVYEWCLDWYGNYSAGSNTDPKGPSTGSRRVCRGGSWNGLARNCRSANRYYFGPSLGYSGIGFRVALVTE